MSLLFPCAAQRITGAALIRLYYKPVSGKKKVSFAKFGKFTINFLQPPQRGCKKTENSKQYLRPEVPERAQQPRAEGKIAHRAEQGGKEHIKPQLAPADAQREEKGEKRGKRAVERVERAGQTAPCRPPQPHGAQQVVEQRERNAEQQRGEKALRLTGERNAHALSPRKGARGSRRGRWARPQRRWRRCARRRAARRRPG